MPRMNKTAQSYDFAAELLAGKKFFERSTMVLEEADSAFCPCEGMMTVAQQVAHTAQTIDWFLDGVSQPEGFDLNFEEQGKVLRNVHSLTEARSRLDAAFQRYRLRTNEDAERSRTAPAARTRDGRQPCPRHIRCHH